MKPNYAVLYPALAMISGYVLAATLIIHSEFKTYHSRLDFDDAMGIKSGLATFALVLIVFGSFFLGVSLDIEGVEGFEIFKKIAFLNLCCITLLACISAFFPEKKTGPTYAKNLKGIISER